MLICTFLSLSHNSREKSLSSICLCSFIYTIVLDAGTCMTALVYKCKHLLFKSYYYFFIYYFCYSIFCLFFPSDDPQEKIPKMLVCMYCSMIIITFVTDGVFIKANLFHWYSCNLFRFIVHRKSIAAVCHLL